MSVAIRLSRGGAKKRPYYKIVVTDARNARGVKGQRHEAAVRIAVK